MTATNVYDRDLNTWVEFVETQALVIDISYDCRVRYNQWVVCYWDAENRQYYTGVFHTDKYLMLSINGFENDLDQAKRAFKSLIAQYV